MFAVAVEYGNSSLWNNGPEVLQCKANTIVFFHTSLYAAQNKSGKAQPETFDAAYLMTQYSGEYDIPEIPEFVKRFVIPVTYHIGKI